MAQSARIGLPFIQAEQALKHATHNEALQRLDALVQLSVIDRDLATPPVSPAEGDAYIVAPDGTGDWADADGKIAVWQSGAWTIIEPKEGWLAWVADEDALVVLDGADWITAGGTSVNPAPLVGVNVTADATNRLSVRSNDILFDAIGAADSGSGDVRVKVNKESAGDTASYLFQTGFSGRAEVGLTGDDDFHFKVSPDGSAWHEGIVIDKDTGEVSFPNTSLGEGSGDVTAAASLDDDYPIVGDGGAKGIRSVAPAAHFNSIKQAASTSATGVVEKATVSEVYAAESDKFISADLIESASAEVPLTDGASPSFDWEEGINRIWTLAANRTCPNPTNGQAGTYRSLRVIGDNGTDRTLSFGTQYEGDLPVLTDIDSTQQYLLTIRCITSSHFVVVGCSNATVN
jgi:hypothetical protein